MAANKNLSEDQKVEILRLLKKRFEANTERHPNLKWEEILGKLNKHADKLWSLYQMEMTGGEPDVSGFDEKNDHYIFYDFSKESPAGRRSACYDMAALEARKKFKPKINAVDMAEKMGIELLNEDQYQQLQKLGEFDTKTSSWLQTPESIRKLGGAIFGDFRFGRVFFYHNGAESYYASRGFRGVLKV